MSYKITGEIILEPRCMPAKGSIEERMPPAITNRGELIPCCWMDQTSAREDPVIKEMYKVSKISDHNSIEGILLTMYDTRLRLSNQVVEEVKIHFQQLVFDTIIHRNTRLGEAPSHGETIIMHDVSSKGAVNYLNLAKEVIGKNIVQNTTVETVNINSELNDQ